MPMVNGPVPLSRDELASVLRSIADGFESGDTLEGSVEFLMGDGSTWDVRASYRIGNTQGQGGMRIVGQMQEVVE